MNKKQDKQLTTVDIATEPQNRLQTLFDPKTDISQAKIAADMLKEIIRQNHWSKSFGGQKEHIYFEGWQTVAKFYNCAVDTDKTTSEYVEYGGVFGFKAHAEVVDTKTGQRIGGASALCMSDERNWKGKDKYALMSMAQTRAGSKALRDIFAFVVALAGFEPSPAEEMTTELVHEPKVQTYIDDAGIEHEPTEDAREVRKITFKQEVFIRGLLNQKGYTEAQLLKKFNVTHLSLMTAEQASEAIEGLMKVAPKKKEEVIDEPEIDMDEADRAIEIARSRE